MYSSKFFRNRKVINCNAYAVVAGLGFVERFHTCSDARTAAATGGSNGDVGVDGAGGDCTDGRASDCALSIAKDFAERRVSMKGWIQRHKGTCTATGRDFQLAFFLDGLKCTWECVLSMLSLQILFRCSHFKDTVASNAKEICNHMELF